MVWRLRFLKIFLAVFITQVCACQQTLKACDSSSVFMLFLWVWMCTSRAWSICMKTTHVTIYVLYVCAYRVPACLVCAWVCAVRDGVVVNPRLSRCRAFLCQLWAAAIFRELWGSQHHNIHTSKYTDAHHRTHCVSGIVCVYMCVWTGATFRDGAGGAELMN